MSVPFLAYWDGEVFRPMRNHAGNVGKSYKTGMVYRLGELNHSEASRGHYFAVINKAWKTLPEAFGDRFTTPDMLRKWALIRAGYSNKQVIACDSIREADRWSTLAKTMNEYAEIGVYGKNVVIVTAESQKQHLMGRKRFQESKDAVFEVLASILCVTVDQLVEDGRSAA